MYVRFELLTAVLMNAAIFWDITPCSPLTMMRLAGHIAQMGEKGNAYRLLVGHIDGKRSLGRPRQVDE
jgi:hypothetical protein